MSLSKETMSALLVRTQDIVDHLAVPIEVSLDVRHRLLHAFYIITVYCG